MSENNKLAQPVSADGPQSSAISSGEKQSPTRSEPVVSAVEAKMHYEQLTSFFHKLLTLTLGSLGIIAAVATWLFFKNLNEAKDAAIATVKADASRLAQAEAQKRVEEAFKQRDISSLIDGAAKKEVGEAVQKRIGDEFARYLPQIRADMAAVARVYDMGTRMRVGVRSGWDQLRSAVETEENETARRQAVLLLAQITKDYGELYKREPVPTLPETLKYARNIAEVSETATEKEMFAGMVKKLDDPNAQMPEIAYWFLVLRRVTGRDFAMFDLRAVADWAREIGLGGVPSPSSKP